jgi:hypothetical protein
MVCAVGPVVERWHDFYVTTGGAVAALLGLLFTSMALRSGQAGVAGLAVESDLWAAATVPFACFLDILLLSLAFLAPDQSGLGLGLSLLGLAALAIALLGWVWGRQWTVPAFHWRWRLLIVLACYLAQVGVAAAVLAGHSALLWLMAVAVGGLIVIAAVMAWDLMRVPIMAQAKRPSAPQAAVRPDQGDPENDL